MSRNPQTGQFILGRNAAERISAVEGLVRSPRIGKVLSASDTLKESGEARRARIRAEFKK